MESSPTAIVRMAAGKMKMPSAWRERADGVSGETFLVHGCDAGGRFVDDAEGDDERELDGEEGEGEGEEGFDNFENPRDAGADVDFGEGVGFVGGFVDDVEIECEEPAPDGDVDENVYAADGSGEEEFCEDDGENENEGSEIF